MSRITGAQAFPVGLPVEADAVRRARLLEPLDVAEAHNIPIRPHFLMELYVSLCAAVPNGRHPEYIPQPTAIDDRRAA